MTTLKTRPTTPAKRTKPARLAKGETPKLGGRQRAAANKPEPTIELDAARVSKHDRILTLLSRRDGATIPEMMEASGWQQHSVRGFLAGTVKKKLGFLLISSKAEGELRRYRVDTKRGL